MIVLTLAFTLFAVWRLLRRKTDRVIESREDFLAYPQTSPEIYEWLPYSAGPPRRAKSAPTEVQTPPQASGGRGSESE